MSNYIYKNIIVGVIYRSPNTDAELFNDRMLHLLHTIHQERKLCYLMGDYNLNLLNVGLHEPTNDFLNQMYSFSLIPVITKPTRITESSATLIDNIFTNDIKADVKSGILYTDISDHFPIFMIIDHASFSRTSTFIEITDMKEENINTFENKLNDCDFSSVLECDNAEEAYTALHTIIINAYNVAFPRKKIKIGYRNRLPWLTPAMKISIRNKNKLYVKSKKHCNEQNRKSYRDYRTALNRVLTKAERNYYEYRLNKNKGDLAKSWRVLKEVIGSKRDCTDTNKFTVGNREVTDKLEIANLFNNYFINIGPSLDKKIPDNVRSPLYYMPSCNKESLYFQPVCSEEILSLTKQLKNSSAGPDSLSPSLLKRTIRHYIDPLVHVLNLSLQSGEVPEELKVSNIIPLFKEGDVKSVNNYRPISLLSALSKLFEKVVYNRIFNFIEKHEILYQYQFGFRPKHSTTTALITLTDKLLTFFDNGMKTVGLFLDFSKAFDTINHKVLLKKLENYGIRGKCLEWIKSYLTNRKQRVIYNGTSSSELIVKCGVPQGSILGPLLFILYINDLSNVSPLLTPIMYADDSSFFLQGTNIDNIITGINTETENILTWLEVNRLSLNTKKSKWVLFDCAKNRGQVRHDWQIKIRGEIINQVENIKFLGIILDERLSWKEHVRYISTKLAKSIGILGKAKKYICKKLLLSLYYSFIYPHLNYVVPVWGNCAQIHLKSVVKMQKKAVRFIDSAPSYTSTEPLFNKYLLLSLEKIYITLVPSCTNLETLYYLDVLMKCLESTSLYICTTHVIPRIIMFLLVDVILYIHP